ncbi:MAG: TIGR00730 family Rossman fold protein [Acidimicrobiales bacterium]
MATLRALCVYCGSKTGLDPQNEVIAAELGRRMADAGVRLVYGGGTVGLMGVIADSVLAHGGEVLGVIPKGLFTTEIGHPGLTELREVGSMHERKAMMATEADAFLALPGGLGTLEELAEIATWSQLGIHSKPVGVLDIDGFWQPLLAFLESASQAGFIKPEHRDIIIPISKVENVLSVLSSSSLRPQEPLLDLEES